MMKPDVTQLCLALKKVARKSWEKGYDQGDEVV